MTTSLLCYWCNDLTDPNLGYVPLGVLVREGDDLVFRTMKYQDLPNEYQPKDKFTRGMFDDGTIERIFRTTTEPSRGQPLSLHFVNVDCDIEGLPLEKAEALYEKHVVSYYRQLKDNPIN